MPHETITPDILLHAYASGVFPMAEDRTDAGLFWLDPDERGILPLDQFHIPRTLIRTLRRHPFTVTVDDGFHTVINHCAAPSRGRETTWISERIESLYLDLHRRGYAHSVECWQDGQIVGGLYGVALGGAFFGESMFHTATNASKIALTYLVARLKAGGFVLLDTQFVTDHLSRFGAIEIPRTEYQVRLRDALTTSNADFYRLSATASPEDILQLITQTS